VAFSGGFARRYLKQGLSVEETAKIIQQPVEFVNSCILL